MTGPVTPSLMRPVAADLIRIGERLMAQSFVIDLENSAMAIPYEALILGAARMAPILRASPIAVIPPPSAVELFREYAWAQAQLGRLCGVFSERARAQDWAEAKGERRLYSRTPISAL
jgi:hypothetical protein